MICSENRGEYRRNKELQLLHNSSGERVKDGFRSAQNLRQEETVQTSATGNTWHVWLLISMLHTHEPGPTKGFDLLTEVPCSKAGLWVPEPGDIRVAWKML